MKNLPTSLRLSLLSFLGVFVALLSAPAAANAASSYISAATGFITESTFKISVYVESTTAEPEIASAQIKINYPQNVNVVSVTEGEFDSYLDKSADATTRTISVNAVNNAGNYKSGKVRVASITFEALANTGQVQLTITPDSEINGSGGEQLLTETINGVYTLDLAATTTDTTDTTTTDTTDTTMDEATSGADIETGGNQIALYLAISLGLVALGVVSYANPLANRA